MSLRNVALIGGTTRRRSTLLDGLAHFWEASEGPANWQNSVSGGPAIVYTQGTTPAVKSVFKRGYGTLVQTQNTFETSSLLPTPGVPSEEEENAGSFTVMTWFSLDSSTPLHVVFAQWGASNRRFRVYYDRTTGNFKCHISTTGSNTSTTLDVPYSEALLLKETTLVIFEYEAAVGFRLKIGNHVSLGAFTSLSYTTRIFNGATGQKFGVGCDSGSGGNKSNAWFGKVSIHDRLLTTEEHEEFWNLGRGLSYPFTPTVEETIGPNEFVFANYGDTQHAVDTAGRRAKQMGWNVADMMREQGIVEAHPLMTHVGDIIHKVNPTDPNNPALWTSSYGLSRYFMDKGGFFGCVYGNHDMNTIGKIGPGRLLSEFHAAYPQTFISNQPTFNGGFFDSTIDNFYQLFTAGGEDWILIATEAVPRDVVMEWVDGLLTTYSTRKCIYLSHQIFSQTQGQADGQTIFMDSNDNTMTSSEFNAMGDRNGGTDQWAYLKGHDNVTILVCGHDNTDRGNGYLTLTKDSGNKAVGLLINFQVEDDTTDFQKGWISFIKVNTTEKTIRVRHWSVAQQTFNWTAASLSITPELLNTTISYA